MAGTSRHPEHSEAPNNQLARASAYARRNFSQANMSDTKWRKLLSVVRACDVELTSAIIKFIDTHEPQTILFNEHWPAVRTDAHMDTFEYGPVAFREIEWLEFPARSRVARPDNISRSKTVQIVRELTSALAEAGTFPTLTDAQALRIVGYSR